MTKVDDTKPVMQMDLAELMQHGSDTARRNREVSRSEFGAETLLKAQRSLISSAEVIDALVVQLQDKLQLQRFQAQTSKNLQEKVNAK